MEFTIIIPAYNSEMWIEECLDSIQNQTYFRNDENKYEILIGIDNCKNTLIKMKDIWYKYNNIRVFWMKKNMGCYLIRNTLIPLSKYDNIVIFDSDDIMKENMIEEIYDNIDDNDVIRYKYINFENQFNLNDVANFKQNNFYSYGTIFLKKKVFFRYNGFMNWVCSADSEFIFKIITNNEFKIKELNEFLLYRRIHDNNLTKCNLTTFKSEIRELYSIYIQKFTKKNIVNKKIFKNKYIEIKKELPLKNINEQKKIVLDDKIKIEIERFKKELSLLSYKYNIDITNKKSEKHIQKPQKDTIKKTHSKPPQKIITTQPEKGNIYVISSQETSRQIKTIQDSIKEFNIIEPTPLDFPEVLNLSYMFEQKLKHDKREIAKKKKEISYSITIRNIIKKAKENNFRKVIVFQDGITFDKDPNTIIPQLEELPENFGVCFLGGYFRKPFLGSFYDYNEHFLELKGSFKIWGTHAIVIGQEIYDVLIKALTINFDKNFQELLCSIIVGKYPSYTYNLPFVFYDKHFLNRYAINNVPVKTLKQDNSNIIKKSKNNK